MTCEVMSNRFYVDNICVYLISSSRKEEEILV
jgi:hypothetical protein